ncbi:protein FAM193B-like isoform X1 [Suricata suricatta]|uniref:protein FAM193B-like isoform X1 n=1 Tax=Suricata suricatta TaxID=37032 RepID=UPI001155713A|nr:protein FAM193B-like isoform X1 [Suricata suricatta]
MLEVSEGSLQTPFNFGMNHRTPSYPAGDYCLLCRSERKDSSFLESGIKTASKLALSMAPKGNSVLHLPLWVCPDCRRAVEKEERRSGLDQPSSPQVASPEARDPPPDVWSGGQR